MRLRAQASDRSVDSACRPPRARTGGVLTVLAVTLVTCLGLSASRAVADDCPNAAVRAQNNSSQLPDCRAYELVSPSFKEGFQPTVPGMYFTDTGAFGFVSIGSFANNGLGSTTGPYVANRTSTGWVTTSLSPSGPEWEGAYGANARSEDLRTTLLQMRRPDEATDVGDFYLREPDGTFQRVGPSVNPASLPPGSPGTFINYQIQTIDGASADLSHIVYPLPKRQGFGSTADTQVYEYVGTGSAAPRMVGLDNNGDEITQCPIVTGEPSWSRSHAISSDGRVIFVTAQTCNDPAIKQLWARVGGAISYEVSSSHCTRTTGDLGGVCNDPADARFEGANADGTRVYFTTTQQLVNGDTDQNRDLYECDIPIGTPTPVGRANSCASFSEVSGAPADADFQGVVRISTDGTRVYFVAHGVLATNHGANDLAAVAGDDNLYVWRKDDAHPVGVTTFVGKLEPGDQKAWDTEVCCGNPGREVETTTDGRILIMGTSARLVAADTDTARDVYRYDADSGDIVRVSAGVDGGNADGFDASITSAVHPYSFAVAKDRAAMTADGGMIVFRTAEALVPEDVNTLSDVYEWHDGRTSLISSGRPGFAGLVLGASAFVSGNGQDIYFNTPDRLSPADGDTLPDIYDARAGGGFPVSQPTSCSGDACQAPRRPAPPALTASSATSDQVGITPAFSVAAATASQRRAFGQTGELQLKVTTNAPAVLAAAATSIVARKSVRVASTSRTLTSAGTTLMPLKLSKKARVQLAANGKLTVKIRVSSSNVAVTRSMTVKLTHSKSKPKTKRATLKQRTSERSAATARGEKS